MKSLNHLIACGIILMAISCSQGAIQVFDSNTPQDWHNIKSLILEKNQWLPLPSPNDEYLVFNDNNSILLKDSSRGIGKTPDYRVIGRWEVVTDKGALIFDFGDVRYDLRSCFVKCKVAHEACIIGCSPLIRFPAMMHDSLSEGDVGPSLQWLFAEIEGGYVMTSEFGYDGR